MSELSFPAANTMRLIGLSWLLFSFLASAQIPAPPSPLREFRGAWVATVGGVDFPKRPGDAPAKQQAELRSIVEKASALKLNALIFQVRPMGDAFYQSSIEPWSPYLTGAMGRAPEPMWDPLAFVIKEAHARGMELHAWFNPFRALTGKNKAGGSHVSLEHPNWVVRYDTDLWMDPGEPGVRERGKAVMLDVLRRYDVDGIHMDDYFYPYPVKKKGEWLEFDDERTWKKYRDAGGGLDRKAWRRENVDTFVHEVYQGIKQEKPWVRFGISPFGLWRPGYPEGTGKGALDPFDAIGADSLKWLQSGWCDYLAPQLYWPIKTANLSYTALFDWWLKENTAQRHIWPGMASERVKVDRQPSEILREISITREHAPSMPPGHIHWNFSALMKNKGTLADLVRQRAYQQVALPPDAPWLGNQVPIKPELSMREGKAQWKLSDVRYENIMKWWFTQAYENGKWGGVRL
ncbi:MAG TPA: family 10 glycosylhydrolase, partial [Verrucomicrobiaceae bacterium]